MLTTAFNSIPQTRALTTRKFHMHHIETHLLRPLLCAERAYRARKAQYLSELEERVQQCEDDNAHLRDQLAMARADPNHIGYNHTRQTAST